MVKRNLYFVVFFMLCSCVTQYNQYIKLNNNTRARHGKWKEEYSSDDGVLQSTGKYKYGTKIGKWKTTLNEKIYQIDRIKNDITKTKFYYANGKVKQMGQSRLEVTANESHWYYFGDWKYFNEKGKLLYLKKYADGKKIDSISYIQK